MLSVIPQDNSLDFFHVSPLELAINGWLDEKSKRSNSEKTATAYRTTLTDFRAALRQEGLDLDGDPRAVSLLAQAWADANKPRVPDARKSKNPKYKSRAKGTQRAVKPVAPGTFNQRIAILSSFYEYARRQGLMSENPTERVQRRNTQDYHSAKPLPIEKTRKLKAISNSSVMADKRDYALLRVGLATGRRASELAKLRQCDVYVSGEIVTLTWRRTKGGKSASDQLSKADSAALLDYLAAVDINFMSRPKDAPIWISLSLRNYGAAIGVQTIADICEKRFGEDWGKVHAMRHTFAKSMLESGAKLPEIQAKLGHSSVATTGRYLSSLATPKNAYSDAMAKLMGLDD